MASSPRPSAPQPQQPPTPLGEQVVLIGLPLLYLVHYFIWPPTLDNLALDVLAFVTVLFIGLAIVSQFVLPVQTWGDRWRVLKHVLIYFFGSHGPIIFVKQGKKIARTAEATTASQGHGVALIDPSSAIVLQRTAITSACAPPVASTGIPATQPLVRAHGPGVCFIEPGEVVVDTLDLRPHKRSATTRALTRDGIEITANVSVTFGLNPQDPTLPLPLPARGERNRPAYPFNPRSAFKAIYGQALGEKHPIPWTELPLSIAVEAFRDTLLNYKLERLFDITTQNRQPFAEFQFNVSQRVQEASVLLERGILVRSVRVSGFDVPAEVLNQRVRVWQTAWRLAALENQAAVKNKTLLTTGRIRLERQQTIVDNFLKSLGPDIPEVQQKALTMLLTHTLQRLSGEPAGRLPPRLSWQALNQSVSQMNKLGGAPEDPTSPMSDDEPPAPIAP